MGTIKGEIGRHEEVYKPAPAPWTQSTSSVRQLLKMWYLGPVQQVLRDLFTPVSKKLSLAKRVVANGKFPDFLSENMGLIFFGIFHRERAPARGLLNCF